MDTGKERQELIELSQKALVKIKAVIPADIEGTDPEKIKIAVQGKLEAIKSCEEIISTVERLKEAEDEQNKTKDEGEGEDFFGIENHAG